MFHLYVFPLQVALRATTALTVHQKSWEGQVGQFWVLVLILIAEKPCLHFHAPFESELDK